MQSVCAGQDPSAWVVKFAVAADCEANGVVICTAVGVLLIISVMDCRAATSTSAAVAADPVLVVIRCWIDAAAPAAVTGMFCRLSPGCTPVMTLAAYTLLLPSTAETTTS